MGFCLFDNVAVAATAALDELGLTRVAIVEMGYAPRFERSTPDSSRRSSPMRRSRPATAPKGPSSAAAFAVSVALA